MQTPAKLQLIFEERLIQAKQVYCSDDLTMFGLHVVYAASALKSRYVQANSHSHKWWLIFDIDSPTATLDWYDQNAPAPNLVVTNPDNGHAHLIYGLEVSVRTASDGSEKAVRYASAIEKALRVKLNADIGYSGLIVKNPLHHHWRVTSFEPNLYTLDWLASYVDLDSPEARKPSEYGLGRNCILFDDLRVWAYKAIRQGWPEYDQWHRAVVDRALGINLGFKHPLPEQEVRHIAKSVAKWVSARFSVEAFSRIQSERGKKGGRPSKKTELLPLVMALREDGYTIRDIADDLQIPRSTIGRWIKD